MFTLVPIIASSSLAFYAHVAKIRTTQTRDLLELLCSTPEQSPSPLGHAVAPKDEGKLVFLRGVVLPLSYANNNLFGFEPEPQPSLVKPLRSSTTGQEAVVVEELTKHISYEGSQRTGEKVVYKKHLRVPFVIASRISKPCDECVVVELADQDNKIPLVTVRSNLKELINHNHIDGELRVDLLREEHVLPLGTIVTALGRLTTENGIPTIKRSKKLPYFLTTKSKDELIEELSKKVDEEDFGDLLSQMSLCLACFAAGSFFTCLARSSR